MTNEEMRRKAAVAIRLALKGGEDSGFAALVDCVSELDTDGQNVLYAASEHLGDAILDVQGRERS